jgi:multiple sugar transport system ATP-binding protein
VRNKRATIDAEHSMTQVVLRKLSLTRGTTAILRDVNLRVEAGEFCVFVGPSGCGKSTLLRLIAGLDEDAEGEIEIDGQPIGNTPAAMRNVAMVFQSYALYPHMTVHDNMAFALQRARVPAAEIAARVKEASRILRLDDYLQRKPGALSGGQRQRVAIGRAIVKKPKVFLFDEPLSNLDASLRLQTRVEIAKLHRDMASASMLYVTHDQVEAMTLADKIVLLRPVAGDGMQAGLGSVAQIGRPMDLYHNPANLFAARFIGSPAMNLLQGRVAGMSGQGVEVSVQGQTCHADVSAEGLTLGDAVTLGIRPEHVECMTGNFRGQVTHIEALGEHSVLYLTLPGTTATLQAKTQDERVAIGDVIALNFPAHTTHLFRADEEAQPRQKRQ